MCGRYASSNNPEDLIEEFQLDIDADVGDSRPVVPAERLEPDYNVAPTKPVYAVVERGMRKLVICRWGLVPSWAKDPSIGNRLINARMETVGEKPSFRRAYERRRCLLPADGYFEWYASDQRRNGRPVKQPYFIHDADGSVLAMAGLYEIWRDPSVDDETSDEAWLWSTTVLTTTATDDLGRIHDRMPLLVARDDIDAWLRPGLDGADPRDLLRPAAPGMLVADPVSTEVNDVAHNGPQLISPLPPTQVAGEVAQGMDVDVDEEQPPLF